ncbi:MAG: AMP-binding protein [Rhabdochlamydiaceae bacterium]
MNHFLIIVSGLLRIFLKLRYRISIKGLDEIKNGSLLKQKGALFLSNHPAVIDPLIILSHLFSYFPLRPLGDSRFKKVPFIRYAMEKVRAFWVPDFSEASARHENHQVETISDEIIEALNDGDNCLVYPSGCLKSQSEEMLGGASLAYQLWQKDPSLSIVMVRITGLWGSSFSRYLTGKTPDFFSILKKHIFTLLKNGVFFCPKREILIELEKITFSLDEKLSKVAFNDKLSAWFNDYKGQKQEDVSLVSYAFWKEDHWKQSISYQKNQKENFSYSSDLALQIKSKISSLISIPVDKIQDDMHLQTDLGLDSLNRAELVVYIDHVFDRPDIKADDIQTVKDAIVCAAGQEKKTFQNLIFETKELFIWPHEPARSDPRRPDSETLAQLFFQVCKSRGNEIACVDKSQGSLTYKELLIKVLILAKAYKSLEGRYVGVLLPSTLAAYMSILAVLLAGKVPVMLNWTIGRKALESIQNLKLYSSVITSKQFINKIRNNDLSIFSQQWFFLEDLKKQITWKDKVYAILESFRSSDSLNKKIHHIRAEDEAVILFTSGTESMPKGVPLTHKNILKNYQSIFDHGYGFDAQEIFYSFLPPFHSLGFSLTGLFPLLTGSKVVYSPDPNDTRGVLDDIIKYKPSLIASAPSFLRPIFTIAQRSQLSSIKTFFSGAEAAPPDLVKQIKDLGSDVKFIEGYGITECSPLVTLAPKDKPYKGVGSPLPGVDIMIFDLENQTPLSFDQVGEILICGENVFDGYLNESKTPFLILQDKKWYVSGDRGLLTEDGFLILKGRSKRFVKLGGEIVNLVALEEELNLMQMDQKLTIGESCKGPLFAVSHKVDESGAISIVLYTPLNLSKELINSLLFERGFPKLAKFKEIIHLEEIPLTGTGKINYRLLEGSF